MRPNDHARPLTGEDNFVTTTTTNTTTNTNLKKKLTWESAKAFVETLPDPLTGVMLHRDTFEELYGKVLTQLDGSTMSDYFDFFFAPDRINPSHWVFRDVDAQADFTDWCEEEGALPSLEEAHAGESAQIDAETAATGMHAQMQAMERELGVGGVRPVGPIQPYDYYCVLDFEATCIEKPGRMAPQEIIELPTVLVDARTMEVVDEFQLYCRPVHHPQLTPFCTELTGIQQAWVDDAPLFGEALAAHTAWLRRHGIAVEGAEGHSMIFVTCGDWDLRTMLPAQLGLIGGRVPQHFRRWVNIKQTFSRVMNGSKGKGMAAMLDSLGLPLEGRHHSGIDDCRNLVQIVKALADRGVVIDSTVPRDFWPGGAAVAAPEPLGAGEQQEAPAAQPPVPWEKDEEELLRKIERFARSGCSFSGGFSGSAQLVMPAGLSAVQRGICHAAAERLGLGHESRGQADQRRIFIWPLSAQGLAAREVEKRRKEEQKKAMAMAEQKKAVDAIKKASSTPSAKLMKQMSQLRQMRMGLQHQLPEKRAKVEAKMAKLEAHIEAGRAQLPWRLSIRPTDAAAGWQLGIAPR